MKYVALLSGGKDSCYNLLHCSHNGHELVAAASLGPENGKEELDSYLYQTVGQDAIEYVAQALDVPLYRRVISGVAVEQGSEYGTRTPKDQDGVLGDETEDLYSLLLTVKTRHPGIQGVSVGAILSNYQRVRVEHVCARLFLTPLCYLWQRDQAELISEMIDAGMEAVLVKVAGIGLKPNHLGKTLAEMESTLIKLNNLYGSHICGEGGEYETLTIDCPFFKKRIRLTEVETVVHADNDFATVAFLRIKNASLDPKDVQYFEDVHVPLLLDDSLLSIRDAVLRSQESTTSTVVLADPVPNFEFSMPNSSSQRLDSWVAVANVHRELKESVSNVTIEDEVKECFQKLQEHLMVHNVTLSQCANINIFISSMDLFARVNAVYGTFFGISPPARACVGVDLPPDIRVKLDCIAYVEQNPTDRQALHVQGLSYWAPANIGPYSQAITVNDRILISGQIGLIPSCLTLPSPPSLAIETALSFQHVERVTNALKTNTGGGWNGYAQAVLYWLAKSSDIIHVKQASMEYEKDAGVPTLFIAVKSLPKNALVEKQALFHTGRCLVIDDDDEPTLQARVPITDKGNIAETGAFVHWEVSYFHDTGASCALICFQGEGDPNAVSANLKAVSALGRFWTRALSIRLFYQPSRMHSVEALLQDLFRPNDPPTTSIPCRFISTRETDDWDYALCILGN
ncbi:hypothetical protein PILCRDRAFT_811423 [Piloderma croceum F 1598]|uniref:Diphthine--ammonia ligase n=1 Tax=Piloderma croceum (strain F 1598) TaxID=765440 RepID=A0A0C3BWK7_PILCF|nr:hypothetical protein PILCRDRAFT_811423 [Piloderma croceum F 1598]